MVLALGIERMEMTSLPYLTFRSHVRSDLRTHSRTVCLSVCLLAETHEIGADTDTDVEYGYILFYIR